MLCNVIYEGHIYVELCYRNHYNIYLVHCTALNVVIEQFPIFNIGKITFSGSVADLISAISKLLCSFVKSPI